jgi:hypothetical protein
VQAAALRTPFLDLGAVLGVRGQPGLDLRQAGRVELAIGVGVQVVFGNRRVMA